MTDVLRQKLCDIVAAHGPAVADDPRRCAELLRQAGPEDGAGVEALVRALEAHVPARLALLTDPLAQAPLTSGLVRRLVEEQGLSEEAARWAVEAWAAALGKGQDVSSAADGFPAGRHILAAPRRRRPVLRVVLPAVVALAVVGAWWWARQRAEVRRIAGRTDGVFALAVSVEGHTVLGACGDQSLRLWDVDTGVELRHFAGMQERPASVALSPDGGLALAGGGSVQSKDAKLTPVDCVVRAWDVATGEERNFAKYDVPVHWVAFAPDGRAALACLGDYEYKEGKYVMKDDKPVPKECVVCLYDVATGEEKRRLEGHAAPVRCAAFTPDGKRVVSAGADDTVRLWDADTGRELKQAPLGGKPYVPCLAVSPDGRHFLTGDSQSRLRLWDLDSLEVEAEQKRHSGTVRAVAFSPDGRRALSGGDDYVVRLWDVEGLTERRHFSGHSHYVTGVAFLPDGGHAVSSSADGTIRVWRLPP